GALSKADAPPGVTFLDNPAGGRAAGAVDYWHADSMFQPEPSMGAVLRASMVPPTGGDTLFANMNAAYNALSPAFQRFIHTLTAANALDVTYRRLESAQTNETDLRAARSVHPVVRVHPETKKKTLFVSSAWTTRIMELSESESDGLLRFFFEHTKRPEFQCR